MREPRERPIHVARNDGAATRGRADTKLNTDRCPRLVLYVRHCERQQDMLLRKTHLLEPRDELRTHLRTA